MTGCDSHLHILDPAFPTRSGVPVPTGMALDDYERVRAHFGTKRAIVVQSKPYGTDHACLLNALARLGQNGRGIAVLDGSQGDTELADLHEAGVRGVRFSLWNPDDAVARFEDIAPLSHRLSELGWHLQLHMHADQIAENAAALEALPCPIVFDHMGRLPPGPDATAHPAFALICALARDARAWVKLSGPYLNTRAPDHPSDWIDIGRAWIAAIPDRLVWGSDWPHVTERTAPPTSDAIAGTLGTWCDNDDDLMHRVLSHNPAELYAFSERH